MATSPEKEAVGLIVKGHTVGKKVRYDAREYRLIKVDKIVPHSSGKASDKEEKQNCELDEFIKKELKKGDYLLAWPMTGSGDLSRGAEFTLMDEKGKYELLLRGIFKPDANNAYGDFAVYELKITEKLSGPKKAWNYLKEL